MSLILNKTASTPAMVVFSTFVFLGGCSQKQHTFCIEDTDNCSLPTPPTLTQSAAKSKQSTKQETLITRVASEPQKAILSQNTISQSSISSQESVTVIEHIRLPTPRDSRYANLPSDDSKGPSFNTDDTYTIQLGAYKLESSRQTAVTRPQNSESLNLFNMANGYLGLSYGRYQTKSEALNKVAQLREQGFKDLYIRTAP